MTPGQVRNLTGPHGRWSLVTDEVLRLLGAPVSAEQRTMAAVLDAGPGARLASQSAASWWGLAGWGFRRQVDLGDDGTWAARVDFVHEVCPLVVEIQSEAYHSALSDRRHDRERLARLRAAGFTVVEVTDTMVWTAPDHALRLVQHGLQLCCGTGQG